MYAEGRSACAESIERLLPYFAFPQAHGKHLRTTNPIESTVSTVKLRTKTTRGVGARVAGLAMAFQLIRVARQTWRKLDAAELVPLVRTGVRFEDGKRVEREDHVKAKEPRKRAA